MTPKKGRKQMVITHHTLLDRLLLLKISKMAGPVRDSCALAAMQKTKLIEFTGFF